MVNRLAFIDATWTRANNIFEHPFSVALPSSRPNRAVVLTMVVGMAALAFSWPSAAIISAGAVFGLMRADQYVRSPQEKSSVTDRVRHYAQFALSGAFVAAAAVGVGAAARPLALFVLRNKVASLALGFSLWNMERLAHDRKMTHEDVERLRRTAFASAFVVAGAAAIAFTGVSLVSSLFNGFSLGCFVAQPS